MLSIHTHMPCKPSQGLSLIELMVALAISTILLLGVTTVYTASKRSHQVNSEVATLQENARFGLHTLTREIRMAGYTGCGNIEHMQFNLISSLATTPAGFDAIDDTAPERTSTFGATTYVTGHRDIDGTGNWTPVFATQPPNIVPNTDAITLRKASACSSQVLNTPNPNGGVSLDVSDNCNFQPGDVVIITDCQSADMFTITAAAASTANLSATTLSHGVDSNSPDTLIGNYNPVDSRVLRLESVVYYIGFPVNGVDQTTNRGLYEYRLINNGGASISQARLLVPEVQDMVMTYGVDTNGDPLKSVDRFAPADQVAGLNIQKASETETSTWARVVRVNLRMLLFSGQVGRGNKPNRPFLDITGVDVANIGNDNDPADPLARRYRRTFSTAINLRNRNP